LLALRTAYRVPRTAFYVLRSTFNPLGGSFGSVAPYGIASEVNHLRVVPVFG